MIRKIVSIDEEKCSGCGLCAQACLEEAIVIENGKARLIRDDYCDGLGNCLPACPMDAISIIEREAIAFDEVAVKTNMAKNSQITPVATSCGCPGSVARTLQETTTPNAAQPQPQQSMLRQWPVQIQLVSPNAMYFDGAHLLIAADCTAYAYANFHQDFIRNRVCLIGCPKLDDADYSKKLEDILRLHEIKSVTVVRMEVPCCGGLQRAAVEALRRSDKMIPGQVITISAEGKIIEQ